MNPVLLLFLLNQSIFLFGAGYLTINTSDLNAGLQVWLMQFNKFNTINMIAASEGWREEA